MNEKGQEKAGFGATVLRALSLIYKYTYLCVHVDIPDPQTHLLPLQLISSPAAVWGLDRGDSPRCDCPTRLWVTSQETTMLGKPGPSCGYCKSSVGTCPWLGFQPDGGVDSARGCGVCPLPPNQDREADGLSDTRESWMDSDAETRMFGWKSSYPASQGRAEQSRITQCSASPAQPAALELLSSWEALGSKRQSFFLSGWCSCAPKKTHF